MRYPTFLKKDKTIYAIAPSFALQGRYYEAKHKQAVKNLEKLGFVIKAEPNIKLDDVDNVLLNPTFKMKAEDLMKAYQDKESQALWAVAGGELMYMLLDYIDFKTFKNSAPKWYLGFSDNTIMSFLLPTMCDVATMYTYNLNHLGVRTLDRSLGTVLDFLQGNIYTQIAYPAYEKEHSRKIETATNPYVYDQLTHWKQLGEPIYKMEGRIIGGCLDVLELIAGTKYDYMDDFCKKYKRDGVILFVESCDLDLVAQLRAYKKLENCGWFDKLTGIVIGRPLNKKCGYDLKYAEMLDMALSHLNIPVVYDTDIGHTAPMMTIINGSYIEIGFENKKGYLTTFLK